MEGAIGTRPTHRVPRRGLLAAGLSAAAVALVPWAFWLGSTLPGTHVARHWAAAWVGFDGALALALASTAITAIRSSPWLVAAASATATLLVVDAWFDVLTAGGGTDLVVAVGEAILVELPLAVLSVWIVRDAERAILTLCDCLRIPRGATNRVALDAHRTERGS